MKNHIRVGGRLLQTNKRFSALKMQQQEWIASLHRSKSLALMNNHSRLLTRTEREQVLQETLDAIEQQGIWILYDEVRRYYDSRINRYYKSFAQQPLANDTHP